MDLNVFRPSPAQESPILMALLMERIHASAMSIIIGTRAFATLTAVEFRTLYSTSTLLLVSALKSSSG